MTAAIERGEAQVDARRRRRILREAHCETYVIGDGGGVRSITCCCCGKTSWNSNDVAERYCANCHEYHEESAAVAHRIRSIPIDAAEAKP